jgi:hypothetical protein
MYTVPSEPTLGDDTNWSVDVYFHATAPEARCSAYTEKSDEPTYRSEPVPSAGELSTKSSVTVDQTTVPAGDSAYTFRSSEPMYRLPDESTAGDEYTIAPARYDQLTTPVDVESAYTRLSSQPTYSCKPLILNAGEERTLPPVSRVHTVTPSELKAYTFLSLLPTKIVPLAPTTGEDSNKLVTPSATRQRSTPVTPFNA